MNTSAAKSTKSKAIAHSRLGDAIVTGLMLIRAKDYIYSPFKPPSQAANYRNEAQYLAGYQIQQAFEGLSGISMTHLTSDIYSPNWIRLESAIRAAAREKK